MPSRRALLCLLATLSLAAAEEFSLGPWQTTAAGHRIDAGARALCYDLDQPYLNGAGAVETTLTLHRRNGSGGWGCAALLLSPEPASFWTLSLVDGPDGNRYVELIELYQGVHQAQSEGPYRLVPLPDQLAGTWEYGHTYRLRLELSAEALRGTITDTAGDVLVARLGYRLQGAPALREGWAALRAEQCQVEFGGLRVEAPVAASSGSALRFPQGAAGAAAIYLGEDLPGADPSPDLTPLQRALEVQGLAVARLRSADLLAEGGLPFPALRVLAADLRRAPADAVPAILSWMRAGGLLVSLTAPAFSEFHWPDGERWVDEGAHAERVLAGLGKDVRPAVAWSADEVRRWHQGFYGKAREAATAVEPGVPDGQPVLALTVPHFDAGWWTMSRGFDPPPARAGEALTCFWARGDGRTPELSLEWTEQDGSRWIAVISLSDTWRYYVLPPQAFRYWNDNPARGRGLTGDQLDVSRAVGLHFGLSASHTIAVLSTDAREHRIQIGGIGFAGAEPAALQTLRPPLRPDLEALCPGYKLFPLPDARRWEPTALGALWGLPARMPAVPALAAIERPRGDGFERGRWWRWIPLLQGSDQAGKSVGSPLSVVVSEMLPYARTTWLSLGVRRAGDLAAPALQQAVAAAVARLLRAPVLIEAGATQYLVRPGEPLKLGAKLGNPAAAETAGEVRFGVDGKAGPRLPVRLAPRAVATVRAAAPGLPAGGHRIVVELWCGGKVVDRVAQPLTVRPAATAVAAADVVRRDGGRFTLGGKPWHPTGCNYWAHNLGGLSSAAYGMNWLASPNYDPAVVEADLAQMQTWGFNALAAVGADVAFSAGPDHPTLRNLEDFLQRCQRHGMKLFFFCTGLDPRGRNDEVARRLIRAVRYQPALGGYDIAWEPGYWAERRRYEANWRAWLGLQYGSLEAAERVLGHPFPRTAGEVAQPPDEWLTRPGPWQPIAAAYRSFMSWQLGAEYRRSAAIVRELDPVHLVGFRGSNVTSPLGFKPVEQPGVLHFMDWAGPEGYDVPAYGRLTDWEEVSAKGLCTRTLSFLSGRKPVIWMEYGMPVYPNGTAWANALCDITASRYQYQVDEGERWYRMIVESGAWGSFPWWYPGGFRVGENSDCGLVDPGNAPRPLAAVCRRFVPRFRETEAYRPDAWIDLAPEANPGGWIGEYLDKRDGYAKLVAEGRRVDVRTAGEGTTSADAPLVDPAGRPDPGAGPRRYLEAIFERVRLRRGGAWVEVALPTSPAPVEVRVPGLGPLELEAWAGNLAEARWLKGAVRLTVSGDAAAALPLAADTGFQGSGHFAAARLPTGGRLRLRLEAVGRAAFGEVLELLVSSVPQA